jgi:hypothetical protein
VAYDLPGTADARVLWGTGRGNYQRTGSILQGTLSSQASVCSTTPGPGTLGLTTLAYTIQLQNPGPTLPSVHVTSTLPAEVTYQGDLWASSGSYGESGGTITWEGAVEAGAPVEITYSAVENPGIIETVISVNLVQVDDGLGNTRTHEVAAMLNGYPIYLPLVQK